MYCPQCGTESSTDLRYCRSCGTNLKVIGKAVTLGEAIARSDRGPLPKIKEMMKNLKVDHVTEEISKALDQMNKEIVKTSDDPAVRQPWWANMKQKTAAQRREKQIVKGIVSLFSGTGLAIFLYFLSSALVLKIPSDQLAQVPFEVAPVVHMIWLIGLVPALSGLGHIMAGLSIRPDPPQQIPRTEIENGISERQPPAHEVPASVTERTTNILNRV